jgi:threonine dehydrogenase-like Zn-dependent dehydrogenase
LPDDVAVFTEPVAAAFQIPVQITIGRNDRIAVLGDGRLGNLCAQVLARLVRPRPGDRQASEKLVILSAMGIDHVLLSDSMEERAFDIVVDCTGSESGLPTR